MAINEASAQNQACVEGLQSQVQRRTNETSELRDKKSNPSGQIEYLPKEVTEYNNRYQDLVYTQEKLAKEREANGLLEVQVS